MTDKAPLRDEKPVTQPKRQVARALLLDNRDRLLLIKWREPVTEREFWEPPGGATLEGESFEAAVSREVAEETGFADIDVGDCVKEFDRRFIWAGRQFNCVERYFLCRLVSDAWITPRLDEIEEPGFVETRWWPREELESTVEELEPPELMGMLEGREPPKSQ
jgi:8-oxo-dGTP pyrophosphatase MutT (NUDIX family)